MFNFNKKIIIGDRMIGLDKPTYIIAEIGGNFDGNMDKAKRLIYAAKEAGADCAKFQTFTADTIVSEGGFQKWSYMGFMGPGEERCRKYLKMLNYHWNGIKKLLITAKK